MTILCHVGRFEGLAVEQGRVKREDGGLEVLYSTRDGCVLMTAETADGCSLGPGVHQWAAMCQAKPLRDSEAVAWAHEHGLKCDPSLRPAARMGLF